MGLRGPLKLEAELLAVSPGEPERPPGGGGSAHFRAHKPALTSLPLSAAAGPGPFRHEHLEGHRATPAGAPLPPGFSPRLCDKGCREDHVKGLMGPGGRTHGPRTGQGDNDNLQRDQHPLAYASFGVCVRSLSSSWVWKTGLSSAGHKGTGQASWS